MGGAKWLINRMHMLVWMPEIYRNQAVETAVPHYDYILKTPNYREINGGRGPFTWGGEHTVQCTVDVL